MTENNTNGAAEQKKQNKVVDTIVNVLLVAVVIFGIVCSYTAFVSARGSGVPEIFGTQFFAIQSESMEDTFFKGDLIVDSSVKDPSKLQVGDIITFWTVIQGERVLNTHRIINIADNGNYLYFTTKGDNNTMEDALGVHQNEIVGKYRFAIPKLGSVIDFMQTSMGFLLVIVLPVFLFFIYNVVTFFRVFFDYRMEKMRMQLKQEMLLQQQAAQAAPQQPEADTETKNV